MLDCRQSTYLRVKDVMRSSALCCDAQTPLHTAAALMQQQRSSAILVCNQQQQVMGIFTEADCKRLPFTEPGLAQRPIVELMSSPVKQVDGELALAEVTLLLHNYNVRHLLVKLSDNPCAGVISLADVFSHQGLEHYLHFRQVGRGYHRHLPVLTATTPLTEAAALMRQYHSDAVLMFNDEHQHYAIVTERDLLALCAIDGTALSCEQVASWPLLTVTEQTSLFEAYHTLKQHRIRHLVVQNQRGEPLGILSLSQIMADLERIYLAELQQVLNQRDEALKQSQRNLFLAEQIIKASLDGIMITDRHGIILDVNPAFSQLTGYRAEEVLGQTPQVLRSGLHDAAFYQMMWQSIRQFGMWQGEITNRKKNGQLYQEWLTILKLQQHYADEPVYAAIFSDITERKAKEQRIVQMAYFDELTRLPNRRLFYDRLNAQLARADRDQLPFAVVFIDVDHFKVVNDQYGHDVGDWLLQQLATRLKHALGEHDTLARLGGDEFVMLLRNLQSKTRAQQLAERLLDLCSPPLLRHGQAITLSISVGIAYFPEHGADLKTLLKQADHAMYQAKNLGRNRVQAAP